ncbi:MAG: protease modulator HflC [Haloferula sp.]
MSTPNKNAAKGCLALIVGVLVLTLLSASLYTVNETQQAIITQFGKPVGEPVTESGLKFKTPFIQKVNMIDRRILAWDGTANEMPTKDKTYILVDTFGRWRISEPLTYFERLRDERSALSRLDDILGSETRNTIAKHELIEVVRTTKERTPQQSSDIAESDMTGKIGVLRPIRKGRSVLEMEIFEKAAPKLKEFGIELLDVRFKRINYNPSVQQQIFQRMISERQQIAERFRSEGAGEAAKIMGNMERDLREIESGAYRRVEEVRGEADAKATAIYADAYNQTAQAAELYDFTRTLKVYEDVIDRDTTVILSTDSELFHMLKSMDPAPKDEE